MKLKEGAEGELAIIILAMADEISEARESVFNKEYTCEEIIDEYKDFAKDYLKKEKLEKEIALVTVNDKHNLFDLAHLKDFSWRKNDTLVFNRANSLFYGQDHLFHEGLPVGVRFVVEEVLDVKQLKLSASGYGGDPYGNGRIYLPVLIQEQKHWNE